jgi:hypothetical protein
MSFAYISKRRKTGLEISPTAIGSSGGRMLEDEFFVWGEFNLSGQRNVIESFACKMSWSKDGLYLAVGTVKGTLRVLNFPNKAEGLKIMKIKSNSSIPRCLEWSDDGSLHFATHNGLSCSFKMLSKSMSENCVKEKSEFYTCAFWKEKILFGGRHINLISDGKIMKTFGPGENVTSCMLVVNDTLFVAYDYSQNSSASKSIIAFSLPSCAPISNQLTDCLFSYSHLCHSINHIYGLTSDGKITRFHAKAPHKRDKCFLVNIHVPYGFKIQFDIKDNILAYGDNSGKLIVKKIRLPKASVSEKRKNQSRFDDSTQDYRILIDFHDSTDPILNVKFHPYLNFIAFSRWKGGFGVLPYSFF